MLCVPTAPIPIAAWCMQATSRHCKDRHQSRGHLQIRCVLPRTGATPNTHHPSPVILHAHVLAVCKMLPWLAAVKGAAFPA